MGRMGLGTGLEEVSVDLACRAEGLALHSADKISHSSETSVALNRARRTRNLGAEAALN